MDSFGAFGELPFATLREADSDASAFIPNVIQLDGAEGYEILVVVQPFQRPE